MGFRDKDQLMRVNKSDKKHLQSLLTSIQQRPEEPSETFSNENDENVKFKDN